MRGSPLLRALVTFCALLSLAPLLWRMTQPRAVTLPAEKPPAPESQRTTLELRLSAPAQKATLQHLGRTLWEKNTPTLDEEITLELPWPKEGIELALRVEWDAPVKHAAARLKATNPAGIETERTIWAADGAADDVLLFP